MRSSRSNADFQATISEVRPDGKETFVQGGWVRGNERRIDKRKSNALEQWLSLRKRDVKALPRKRRFPASLGDSLSGMGKQIENVDIKKARKQIASASKQFGALTKELRKAGEQAEKIGDALS